MSRISVVIPAYDRAATIGVTLESLLAQSQPEWEAIVVDDGSADGTYEIATGYAARDPRITVLRQDNAGVSTARNRGLAAARNPWLFFLDADDWIAPNAFELLIGALREQPDADLVHGGCVRVLPDGTEIPERSPPPAEELFLAFARTCAFSIHTCMARTELARQVGGFDESLVTCEDWDLWQRIARLRPRFVQIPDPIAYYRIRPESASRRAAQILRDGLRVIERGHGDDPRLRSSNGSLHPGERRDRLSSARMYLTAYAAGLRIAECGDARELLTLVPDGAPGDVDGDALADTLFHAIVSARAAVPAAWSSFPPEINGHLERFIEAMANKVQDNWLAFTTTETLERLIVECSGGATGSRRIGSTELVALELGAPAPHLQLDPTTRRVVLELRDGDQAIGTVVVPAVDGLIPAPIAADALAEELAWDVLRRYFERAIYPQLKVAWEHDHLTVHRGRVLLADIDTDPGNAKAEVFHDAVGWPVFLQELWGRPDWSSARFYDPQPRTLPERARTVIDGSGGGVSVEISDEIPAISAPRDSIDVEVTIAGVPFMAVRMRSVRGRVRPAALRRAITHLGRFELCRLAVREALLFERWDDSVPLRQRLRELARRRQSGASQTPEPGSTREALLGELIPPGKGAIVVGRRRTYDVHGAASRLRAIPVAAADIVVEGARAAGQEVVERRGDDGQAIAVYAPFVFEPASIALPEKSSSNDLANEFDELFTQRADPWEYGSEYEQHKYDDTIALIPPVIEHAIEVGCAEGLFTGRLAQRATRVSAVDVSRVALARAQERCAGLDNVDFHRIDVFSQPLPGQADLVVCSEMLYYARSRSELRHAVRAITNALRSGGMLVTTHSTALVDDPNSPGFDWHVPFGAAGLDAILRADRRLVLREERRAAMYWVQRYERVSRLAGGRVRRASPLRSPSTNVPHLSADVGAHFHPDGGSVAVREVSERWTERLPILMYHRVSSDFSAATRRWTVTPEEFERQLEFLRTNGFSSIDVDEWAALGSEVRSPSGRRILLTFDDGYEDFAEHALPLLERYGFRAELFVVTDYVGKTNSWESYPSERYPLMDWATLVELPERTVRIGSHTETHPLLTALPDAEAVRELARSRRTLEDRLGRKVTTVAYPYGPADGAIERLASAAGYDFGYSTHGWRAFLGRELLKLPRLEVQGGIGPGDFEQLVLE